MTLAADIPVVILCGGKGTRLREETEYKPKPMVEIGGRPILWHIMKTYAHYGFNRFILCLGYRGSVIKDYFLNYEAMNNNFTVHLGVKNKLSYENGHEEQGFQVTLVDTGLETMTGARIKRIQPYVNSETFMVTYGDGLADLDLSAELAYHQAHGKLATLVAVQPPSRFGILDLAEDNRIRRFREKVRNDWINGGFFIFNRQAFDYLDEAPDCVLEQAPLERLAAAGQLVAYRHTGFWIGMDTFRECEMLNDMWNAGKAAWAIWRH
jgi:glucose-1-phosphate cytidylyltransferase